MPGAVVRVHDRIWQIQAPFVGGGLVMLYLIRGSKLGIIDTGVATSPGEDVRPALKSLGLDMSDVNAILNTHGHHDHLGGNGNFKQAAPAAAIHLHSADRRFAEADSHAFHRTFMTEFLTALGRPDLLAERQAVFVKTLSSGDAGVDRILEDGDRVDLGDGVELTVIHTPGHTPGSVCYYWEREKLLLTGDAVQGRGSRAGGWPLYFNAADYMRSIERLKGVDVETLCLGHGFHSAVPLNSPIRRGEEAREIVTEAGIVSRKIDDAVRARLQTNPSGSYFEIAQAVTMDLLDSIPTLLDPNLRLPGSPATLWAHIREARAH